MVDANVEVIDHTPDAGRRIGVELPWAANGADVFDPALEPRPAKGDVFDGARSRGRGAARRPRPGGAGRRPQVRVVRDRRPARYSCLSRPLRRVDRPAGRSAACDAALRPSGGRRHLPAAAGRRSGSGVPPCPHHRRDAGPAGRCGGPDARGRSQRGGRGDHPALLVSGPRSPCGWEAIVDPARLEPASTRWRCSRLSAIPSAAPSRWRPRPAPAPAVRGPTSSWTRSFRCSGRERPASTAWSGRARSVPLDPRRCAAADAARFPPGGDRDRRADDRPAQAASASRSTGARSSIRPSAGAGTRRSIWGTAGSRRPRSRSSCRATRTFPGPRHAHARYCRQLDRAARRGFRAVTEVVARQRSTADDSRTLAGRPE